MPVRTVYIELVNQSGHELRKSRVEICWGKWSDRLPDVIPSGATAVFRAESSGVMAGTSGILQYEFRPISGARPPTSPSDREPEPWPPFTVSFFFDNPFFAGLVGRRTGLAHHVSRTEDINLECGSGAEGKNPNPSLAALYGNSPMQFELIKLSELPGHESEEQADLVPATFAAATGHQVLWIVGKLGIVEHPIYKLVLRPNPNAATPPVTFETFTWPNDVRPKSEVAQAFWPGNWKAVGPSGKVIKVHIQDGATSGSLRVAVEDNLEAKPFAATNEAALARPVPFDPWVSDAWVPVPVPLEAPMVNRPPSPNDEVLVRRAPSPNDAVRMQRPPAIGDARLVQPVRTRRLLTIPMVATLRVTDDCYLQAYEVEANGQVVGKRLRYVRSSAKHVPACDVMLNDRLI